MRVHVLDKWVEAMESGKYNFCVNRLRRLLPDFSKNKPPEPGKYVICHCAAGVLCEVGVELGVVVRNGDTYRYISGNTECATSPPRFLLEYIAEERKPEPFYKLIDHVIAANDSENTNDYTRPIAVVKAFLSNEPESKYYVPKAAAQG